MERIQSINPARLEWCLADRGVTVETCAIDLGIAQTNLKKVLDGEPGLTFNQLRKVAEYFGRGVLFFLEPGLVVESQVHSPQFRTLANRKPELSGKLKALIERVERQRDVYMSLRDEVDSEVIPMFQPPRIPRQDVRAAAVTVRRWLALNIHNTFETYRQAIESKGILVFRSNGYNGKWQIAKESPILGFSLYDAKCPVIVVRKRRWDSQQCFTLMHELGHILLERASSIDDESDIYHGTGNEQRANAFAGFVLVPDEFLGTIRDDDKPSEVSGYDGWLAVQRKSWGVSTEVILRRLLDARRLTSTDYNAYRHWCKKFEDSNEDPGGSREYRHREPKHIFGEPYVRTVLEALNTKKISLNKASTYLDNLKIRDLRTLEQHCASL